MNEVTETVLLLFGVALVVALFAYLGRFQLFVRKVVWTDDGVLLMMRRPVRNRLIRKSEITEWRVVQAIDLMVEANPFRTKAVFPFPRREVLMVRSNTGWINTWLFRYDMFALVKKTSNKTREATAKAAPPL